MKSPAAESLALPPAAVSAAPVSAMRRVLVVDDDPAILYLITQILAAEPLLFAPRGVASAEEALAVLASTVCVDCLLADIMLPGMDGIQLLVSARALRPELKIVVMTSSPTDEIHRAVLDSGASRLLAKPLDLEDLLASVAAVRPGTLAYLSGSLDLMDLCRLSVACRPEGRVRVRNGESAGILTHRGTTLIHISTNPGPGGPPGPSGEAALASLQDWGSWQFESLSSLSAEPSAESCELAIAAAGEVPFREGAKASGNLRGLTIRHLIEWAIQGRVSCAMTVASRRRKGHLSFADGKIREAETKEHAGGRAAAEILSWDDLQVEVIRPLADAALRGEIVAAPTLPADAGFAARLEGFAAEVEGFLATAVCRRIDGSSVANHSADPRLGAAAAAGGYARVLDGHLAALAVAAGPAGAAWGETEDLLITTTNAYLLIRLLGDGHYHWLAVASDANLAFCRHVMRSWEAFLRASLADLGEIPG